MPRRSSTSRCRSDRRTRKARLASRSPEGLPKTSDLGGEHGAMLPTRHGVAGLALHFALRSDDSVEVGVLGGDITVLRGGWLARMLRGRTGSQMQEVLLVAERRLPMALATVPPILAGSADSGDLARLVRAVAALRQVEE